jgi:hypothetical protein
MSDAEVRRAVLAMIPQAQYMNLSSIAADGQQCHAIDDAYNDRYLAMGRPSRRAAWRAAYRFLARSAGEAESQPKEGQTIV